MLSSRQLAAIMFTDIAGYTSLMGEDEQKAFETLHANRQLQKPIIEKYKGKWIKEIGDGILASFPNATDAVMCATEIQRACKEGNDFQVRIGIHLGEVVFEEDDVFGDGVNITSRIQALAPIGGIWISEAVHRNISNKKEFTSRFVKKQELKNVKEPLSIYEIMAGEAVTAKVQAGKGGTKQNNKSIAILPFVNMSNDPEQEYFSDGMAEEILNSLAHLKDLKVAGRTSAFQFKGVNIDLREVGDKLGVSTVLEGSVRKQGNRLRVTAQLINVADGFHLWSEKYDRNADDIFAIQDDIAFSITESLKLILLEREKAVIRELPTDNTEAYRLYLKGRYEWGKRTRVGFFDSINFFEQAIAEDPRYSLPYAGMADCYTLLCSYHILSPGASIPKAREATRKAMELSPALPEAHEAAGHIELLAGNDWQKAERDYKQAIQLNPGFATARQRYALLLAAERRYAEALEEIRKAQELEPLSKIINTDAGLIWLLMGQAEVAARECNKVLEVGAPFFVALFVLGLVYEQEGETDLAIHYFREALKETPDYPIIKSALAHALAIKGDESEALRILEELKTLSVQQFVSPYCMAVVYAGLQKKEESLTWLRRAADTKSLWMIHLHFSGDPRLAPLKNEAEYQAILRG